MKKQFYTVESFLAFKKIERKAFSEMEENAQGIILQEYDRVMKEYHDELESKLTSAIEQLEKSVTEEKHKAVVEEIERIGLELKKFKSGEQKESVFEVVNKFIADNADEIKKMYNSKQGFIEITIDKAVGSMTTGSASVPSPIPAMQGVQVAPPNPVSFRTAVINSLVSSENTNQASLAYTETVPKDGDYAFVAEAGIKPQIDFKIETRYANPKKIAAHITLTEESVTDIPRLQSIAQGYLVSKHDLKKEKAILNGDGLGENPKGATKYGRLFTADGMATKVVKPNFMDVVNAAITDIYTTHNYQDEMPYMANIVLVNPVDFFTELVAAKDEMGRQLYPMASLFNRVVIGGVTILPHEDVVAGKIFVSDLSKYNTSNYVGFSIRIGWINDQFITNQFTMVGESRFHAYVRKLDEQAFIYDDIATIKTAITKA